MHDETLATYTHEHDFANHDKQSEKRTLYVLILTAVTMIAEILAGTFFGSMALLADGWHMATHVAAFMVTLFAYRYARQHAHNPTFTFGTGKVSVLAGFASAVGLTVVSLMMGLESIERLVNPATIQFNAAIGVAFLGLMVNVASVFLLTGHHDHDHDHDHDHGHGHGHGHGHDHNLQAAYFHVLADALTSLLAIFALMAGKYFGWGWCDPIMGILGGVIIAKWAWGLIKTTSPILLDSNVPESYKQAIKETIETDADNRISDLHIWNIGQHHYACIISIVTDHPKETSHYKEILSQFDKLAHINIEINRCKDSDCKSDS